MEPQHKKNGRPKGRPPVFRGIQLLLMSSRMQPA